MKYLSVLFVTLISISMIRAQDQGMTSTTHADYVNKIVFAKSLDAISFRNEKPSQFTNSFNASDNIYSRIYLDKSIGNTPHEGKKCWAGILMYDMYIDGNKVPFKKEFGVFGNIPENEKTYYMEGVDDHDQVNIWTSWRPTLLPKESDEELKYGNVNIQARCFALALLDLQPGKHEVTLKMYSRSLDTGAETGVLAEGSFSINLTAADKKALAFKYTPPLPKDEWVGGNKEAIKNEIREAFINQLGKTPIVVGISGRDWRESSYTLTGQKYRKISGWAIFEDGDGDGQVPITTFNWISDYTNGGWTKLRFDSHCLGCPNWDVEVAAVKAMASK